MATAITRAMADGAEIGLKMTSAQTVQESKNLFQMSWKEAMNFLRNKNMLKTNSEEYLTYKLKQNMPGPKIVVILDFIGHKPIQNMYKTYQQLKGVEYISIKQFNE